MSPPRDRSGKTFPAPLGIPTGIHGPALSVGAAVIDFIRRKWRGGDTAKCEMCGNSNWGVAEQITVKANINTFPYSAEMPFYPVICQVCGNTKLLHGLVVAAHIGSDE